MQRQRVLNTSETIMVPLAVFKAFGNPKDKDINLNACVKVLNYIITLLFTGDPKKYWKNFWESQFYKACIVKFSLVNTKEEWENNNQTIHSIKC